MEEKKSSVILRYILVGIGYLSLLLIALPIFTLNGSVVFTYEFIFVTSTYGFAPLLLLTILIAPLGATLLIFKKKLNNATWIALLLYLLEIVFLCISPSLATIPFNSDLPFTLHAVVIVYSVILGVAVVFLCYLVNLENKYTVYEIVEAAMLIGIAVLLDLDGLKISLGANGGSISFTTIPLVILALRQGAIKGFIGIGIIYGLITCLIDGWGLQTYPFDYFLAYGVFALFGLFKTLIIREDGKYNVKSVVFIVIASLITVSLRLLFSTISGVIIYEMSFKASLLYNILYVLPSGGVALVVLIALYKPLCMIERMYKKRENNDANNA